MLLSGKTALVTGAAKGIGKGIALELAAQGCDVAINDYQRFRPARRPLHPRSARWAAKPLRGSGQRRRGRRSGSACSKPYSKQFPRLDILVNNAGVQTWKALLDLEERDWDRVIATNLKGCFLCTQRAARHMKDTGGGRIVNIGSGCNKVAFPKLVDYTASRGGIEMFTKVAAVELGPYQITVNCVAPGAIETERTKTEAAGFCRNLGPT